MSTTHTPAGHCRACDYPMDPGRCPECGMICPDVSPLPQRPLWPIIRRAAIFAAIPPAFVFVMAVAAATSQMTTDADTFLMVGLIGFFSTAALTLFGLTLYAVLCFVRRDKRHRTWKTAAILLSLPFMALLGIAVGWGILFARFAD